MNYPTQLENKEYIALFKRRWLKNPDVEQMPRTKREMDKALKNLKQEIKNVGWDI